MKYIYIFLFCLLVGTVAALPTTLAATNVGNNNFTISATGMTGDGWFQYGIFSDRLMVWTTPGENPHTEIGSPLEPSMTYYAAGCDVTGCGNVVSFTTLPSVPLPVSTLGSMVTNMTRSKFNVLYLIGDVFVPYTWLFPASAASTAITIVCGMMFFFIYVGFWMRTKSVGTAAIIGLLTASSIMFGNRGLNLGIPVEFQAIAQALLYASLAGIFISFLKR